MIVPLKIQELMRERMLANIDINKVELLVGDRNKLIGLLSQTFDDLFNNNEYNLTTQAQNILLK